MKLYLLRHAHAEDGSGDDHTRRLTDEGVHYSTLLGRLLKKLEVQPKHIYTSPRVRALQTAEIVAKALNVQVEKREEVNFGFNIPAIETLIKGLSPNDEVMFVGHEPFFSSAVHDLTGGRAEMKKCGIARIDLTQTTPPRGELIWLLAPKLYEALGS